MCEAPDWYVEYWYYPNDEHKDRVDKSRMLETLTEFRDDRG